MSGWTQPICAQCWAALKATRIIPCDETHAEEFCAICLIRTRSGIYIRRDPALDMRTESEKGA